MKTIERAVWATDFSRSAESALKSGLYFSQNFGSEMILIHVIPQIGKEPINKRDIRREANARIETYEKRIRAKGVKTEKLVSFGIPFEEVIEQTEIHDAGIIFIGSGDLQNRIGITAENIIRFSEKPVWMVKKSNSHPARKILCPVDFSKPSGIALNDAIFLARSFSAELVVLTVVEKLRNVYFSLAIPPANIRQDWVRHEHARFLKFLKGFDFEGVTYTKSVRQGKPDEEIIKVAAEQESDLVIMGSLGKTGLTKVLLGSTAEKVARQIPCSVLVSKKEGIYSAE
jgi:nucleotide-binding universal stress UspA family protein